MKTNNPSLFLYLFASIFVVIGIIMGNEPMVFLMKPMIIPAILYYYIQIKKEKTNWFFIIALLSNFSSDMLVLFKLDNGDALIALLNMVSYSMFLYFAIKEISLNNLSNMKFFYFALIVIGCITILYVILGLMSGLDNFYNNLYIVYGVLLCTLSSIIGFNHINKQNEKTFYALIMCICFITSDVFFAIYNFYLNLEVFVVLNVIAQFTSYYYMVRYITTRNPEKEEFYKNEI